MADKTLGRCYTARTRKRCTEDRWNCRNWIEPGEVYLRVALPPGSDLGNTGWWTMNICKGCMYLRELNDA
jgi:hypothetical protein